MFTNLILHPMGFHLCITFIGTIGNLYKFSGLEEWNVESNLYGPNALGHILGGKQYNRGVRVCKLMLEAVIQKKWEIFCVWVKEHDKMNDEQMYGLSTQLKEL